MAITMRAQQSRLLGDSADTSARLARAVGRAEFLLRASRAVSAVQNPSRALELLVQLMLDELADVVQVVVRTGTWQLWASGAHGLDPASGVTRWSPNENPAVLESVLQQGVPQYVRLPAQPERDRVLAGLWVEGAATFPFAEIGVDHVVVLPLLARGRVFGSLLLGGSSNLAFDASEAFLDDLCERLAVGLDAVMVVAESRHVADVMRRSLAPAELPEFRDLDLASFYRVAYESQKVGGDFLDVHGTHEDLTIVCGDVVGKGVEAAVRAKRIRSAVRTLSLIDRDPAWILGLVNRVITAESEEVADSLATACCVRLRPEAGVVRVDIAHAGHPPALVLRADGTVEELATQGLLIGMLDEFEYDVASGVLDPGDTLVVYTDGVTEARGVVDMFGEARLHDVLATTGGLPARTTVDAVAEAVTQHLGDRSHDDIAVLAVQFRPESPADKSQAAPS